MLNCCCQNYEIDMRTEFITRGTPSIICQLLQELKNQSIKIDGYSIVSFNDNCTFFRFVVGDENNQSDASLQSTKAIFSNLSLCYLEDCVLKVSFTNNLPMIYCALQSNVNVNASYFARCSGMYFQVDDVCQAINDIKSAIPSASPCQPQCPPCPPQPCCPDPCYNYNNGCCENNYYNNCCDNGYDLGCDDLF